MRFDLTSVTEICLADGTKVTCTVVGHFTLLQRADGTGTAYERDVGTIPSGTIDFLVTARFTPTSFDGSVVARGRDGRAVRSHGTGDRSSRPGHDVRERHLLPVSVGLGTSLGRLRAPHADPSTLLASAAGGDYRALGRLLSLVERGDDDARALARAATAVGSRQSWVVGLTGAPGAGKSTLAAALVGLLRSEGERVAVLAVDPSSPLSGGALLGDRVRMQAWATDPGVFVRSMASRGAPGGLARATPDAVRLLVAAGWPWVLVETVGVGQGEVDLASVADTTVVLVTPGWGDDLQAEKAGVMEVAEVFVVNKADRPGAAEARGHLEDMLALARGQPGDAWRPPVVEVSATTGSGVAELWSAVGRHRAWRAAGGQRPRAPRARPQTWQ